VKEFKVWYDFVVRWKSTWESNSARMTACGVEEVLEEVGEVDTSIEVLSLGLWVKLDLDLGVDFLKEFVSAPSKIIEDCRDTEKVTVDGFRM